MRRIVLVGLLLFCVEQVQASKGPCDGLPSDVPSLLSILKDGKAKLWHRAAVCIVTKKLTDPEAQETVSLLITSLRDPDKRRTAATALREQQPIAIPELIKLLKDDN